MCHNAKVTDGYLRGDPFTALHGKSHKIAIKRLFQDASIVYSFTLQQTRRYFASDTGWAEEDRTE